MKNSFLRATLFCALTGLSACHDDTKELLQSIDGQWEVKSIQFTDQTNRDSTATPSQAYLNFESCSKSSNSGSPNNCALQYRVGSQNYNFTYQATDGKKALSVSSTASQDPTYQQIASIVAGSYDVLTLTSTSLILRKKTNCTTSIPESCNYVQVTAAK